MAEWLIKWDEGQAGTLTPLGVSLWYGAALAEVLRYAERREEPPAEWLRAAKRRSREAAAHLGSDPVDILRYWADKDLAADVLNVYDGVLLVER